MPFHSFPSIPCFAAGSPASFPYFRSPLASLLDAFVLSPFLLSALNSHSQLRMPLACFVSLGPSLRFPIQTPTLSPFESQQPRTLTTDPTDSDFACALRIRAPSARVRGATSLEFADNSSKLKLKNQNDNNLALYEGIERKNSKQSPEPIKAGVCSDAASVVCDEPQRAARVPAWLAPPRAGHNHLAPRRMHRVL